MGGGGNILFCLKLMSTEAAEASRFSFVSVPQFSQQGAVLAAAALIRRKLEQQSGFNYPSDAQLVSSCKSK